MRDEAEKRGRLITVKAREGWENDRKDTDRNVLRTIIGQKKYLDQHAHHSGTLPLSNAFARWWVLRKENALTQNSGFIASSGHCAALYKSELYEMAAGRANTVMLQMFGIIFGYQQVVIYIDPDTNAGLDITTDTARHACYLTASLFLGLTGLQSSGNTCQNQLQHIWRLSRLHLPLLITRTA